METSSGRTGSSIKRFFSNAQSIISSSSSHSPVSRTLPAVGNAGSTFYAQDPTQAGQVVKKGWLRWHVGGRYKPWVTRYFVFAGEQLFYYTAEDESKPVLGQIYLMGYTVNELPYSSNDPHKYLFQIVPTVKKEKSSISIHNPSYLLCCDTDEERKDWVYNIKRVLFGRLGGAIFGRRLEETLDIEKSLSKFHRKIPQLVDICVRFLYENGLTTEGLFRLPGRSTLVKQLRNLFDSGARPRLTVGSPADRAVTVDVHSVASLLKSYLRELPEPLIPFSCYQRVMHIAQREMSMDSVHALDLLAHEMLNVPESSRNLLRYMCKFLSDVSAQSDVNKMTSMNLATVFSQSFIRPELDDPALLMGTSDGRTAAAFILISQVDKIFAADEKANVMEEAKYSQTDIALTTLVPLRINEASLPQPNKDDTGPLPTPDLIRDAGESPRSSLCRNKDLMEAEKFLARENVMECGVLRNKDVMNKNNFEDIEGVMNKDLIDILNIGDNVVESASLRNKDLLKRSDALDNLESMDVIQNESVHIGENAIVGSGVIQNEISQTADIVVEGISVVQRRISRQTPLHKQQRSTRRTGMFFNESNSLAEGLQTPSDSRSSGKSLGREQLKRSASVDELEPKLNPMSPRWFEANSSSFDELNRCFNPESAPSIANCDSLICALNSCESDIQSLSSYRSCRQSFISTPQFNLLQEDDYSNELSAILKPVKEPENLERGELVDIVRKLTVMVKSRDAEITKLTRRLRGQEIEFENEIEDLKRQLNEERDARFVAVNRVVDIQTKLTEYSLRFGTID